MVFVYSIDSPADIVRAFIDNDDLLSRVLNHVNEYPDEYEHCQQALMKELYVAPFCFVRHQPRSYYGRKTYQDDGDPQGFLVLMPMVPWYNNIHKGMIDEMEHERRRCNVTEIVHCVEQFLDEYLKLGGTSVHTITKDGYYPTPKGVQEEDLYEKAIHISCSAMGWNVPANWRQWHIESLTQLGIKAPTIDEFNNFMPAARHCNRTQIREEIGYSTPKRQRESSMNTSQDYSRPLQFKLSP